MPKFAKKTLAIYAVKYNGLKSHTDEIKRWVHEGNEPPDYDIRSMYLITPGSEDALLVHPGEWIVKEPDGTFNAYSEERFNAMYLKLPEEDEEESRDE